MRLLRVRWWLQRNFLKWFDRAVLAVGGIGVIYAGFFIIPIVNMPLSVLIILLGLYIIAIPWLKQ